MKEETEDKEAKTNQPGPAIEVGYVVCSRCRTPQEAGKDACVVCGCRELEPLE